VRRALHDRNRASFVTAVSADHLLHLTGAALLVFQDSMSHRRPRQVSIAFGAARHRRGGAERGVAAEALQPTGATLGA
jgi:hypothetical protein